MRQKPFTNMSRVTLIDPIESIKGKIYKRGDSIFHCKQFRDEHGHVVAQGPQEAYVIAHPRDRKKNPPTGAEQQHLTLFGEASRRAKAELAQDPPRRAYWEQRFRAQLSKPEHLDPSAPSSPLRKQYQQLHPFVRATIYIERRRSEM